MQLYDATARQPTRQGGEDLQAKTRSHVRGKLNGTANQMLHCVIGLNCWGSSKFDVGHGLALDSSIPGKHHRSAPLKPCSRYLSTLSFGTFGRTYPPTEPITIAETYKTATESNQTRITSYSLCRAYRMAALRQSRRQLSRALSRQTPASLFAATNLRSSPSLAVSVAPTTIQTRCLATPVPPVTQNATGSKGPTAMVFLNMGGPSTTEEVHDFLLRLFVGAADWGKRLGGRSPLEASVPCADTFPCPV